MTVFFLFWVILVVMELVFVAEFWWKVLSGYAIEREKRKVEGKERYGREEREIEFFIIFVAKEYIILISYI